MIKCYSKWKIFIVVVALFTCLLSRAQDVDSLKLELARVDIPASKAHIINEIARAFLSVNLDSAEAYALNGIRYAKENSLSDELGKLYNTTSIIKIYQGQSDESFLYNDSALAAFLHAFDKEGMASALGNRGTLYIQIGSYQEALKFQYICLELNEQLNDKSAIATTLSNILAIYMAMKDITRALEISYKADLLFTELNEIDGIALASYNIASVYLDLKQLDSCEKYANKSLELFQSIHSREGIADAKRLMGGIHRIRKNYDQAIDLMEFSLNEYEQIGIQGRRIESIAYLSSIYFDKRDYATSIVYAKQALELARENHQKQFERDATKILSDNYRSMGDFKSALFYNDAFSQVSDQILNENSISEINRLKNTYEAAAKEKELLTVKQQKRILELDLNLNRYFILILVISIVLFVVVGVFLFRQRKLIIEQKSVLLEQRLLRAQMNPHFIFNSLSAIQSFVYKNEAKEAGKYLASFAKLIRIILDNSREELILLSKEVAWLENYLNLQLLRFENRLSYELIIDENVHSTNLLIPPMLAQPFIENSLEHGFSNIDYQGHIAIHFKLEQNYLVLVISDNGVGISASDSSSSKDHHSHATAITLERLALLNKNRKHQITFNIQSKKGNGTLVEFKFPMN